MSKAFLPQSGLHAWGAGATSHFKPGRNLLWRHLSNRHWRGRQASIVSGQFTLTLQVQAQDEEGEGAGEAPAQGP